MPTRGDILRDRLGDLSISSKDPANPAAAHDAQLLTYMRADSRFTQYMGESADQSPMSAESKSATRGVGRRTQQRSQGEISERGEDPAMRREADQLYNRINSEGNATAGYTAPDAMTAEQRGVLRGYYARSGIDIDALAATRERTGSSASFLASVQSFAANASNSPEEAQFAMRVAADPRYMQNVETALAGSGLPESVQNTMRRVSQATHDTAESTMRFSPASAVMGSEVNRFYASVGSDSGVGYLQTASNPIGSVPDAPQQSQGFIGSMQSIALRAIGNTELGQFAMRVAGDPRYMPNIDAALENSSLPDGIKSSMRRIAVATHDAAEDAMGTNPPTAEMTSRVDGYYNLVGAPGLQAASYTAPVASPTSNNSEGFLPTMQALAEQTQANPNGPEAAFAMRVAADPRYMQNVEVALATSGLPDSAQNSMRRISEATHDAAVTATRFNPPDAQTSARVDTLYAGFHGESQNTFPRTNTFLDSVRDLNDQVQANPNGPEGQLALRMMADPRYMQNVDSALAGSGLPQDAQDTLHRISEATHRAAVTATRFNPADAEMSGKVGSFYAGFEQDGAPSATAESTSTPHTIERGDSLWKIAKEHYGLTDPKDIQAAVENIAGANRLDQNNVSRLGVGQEIRLPDSPSRQDGSPALDWAAMDRDAGKLRGSFRPEATATASVAETADPAAKASTELASPAPLQSPGYGRQSGSAFDRMTV